MKQIYYLFLLILLTGCPGNTDDYDFKYDIIITNQATNLEDLNTQYDDFNSDLPYEYDGMDIFFSSNRNSQGHNFDIVAKGLSFSYHEKDNVLNLAISNQWHFVEETSLLFEKLNTENNELGPFAHYYDSDLLFLYASDLDGIFKIKLIEYIGWNNSHYESVISGPTVIPVINDVGNNLYPSYNYGDSKMFFCSDRNDSVFNIYSAIYNNEISKTTLLNGDIISLQKDAIFSSTDDDKCPFVNEDIMLFTSNRKGGIGGFDLYYSFLKNGSWTSPQVFGNNINTEYDEYRPIIFKTLGFNLMIFSSNRPGGQGGYDLYIVNITELIK